MNKNCEHRFMRRGKKPCPTAVEIDYVQIPSSWGTSEEGQPNAPENGAYKNAVVEYEADGNVFIYTSEGIPVRLSDGGARVRSVNGKTGHVVLTTSDLENDSGYLTADSFVAGEDIVIDVDEETGKVTISVDDLSHHLYTEPGDNTDGAMTQKATTNLVFPANSENTRDRVAIGRISSPSTVGENTIEIRATTSDSAPVTSINAVSITSGSLTEAGDNSVEIGSRTSVGDSGVAIGSQTIASENNIAVGSSANAYGLYSQAVGFGSRTGTSASSSNNYSLALGAFSTTSRNSEVSFGDGSNNQNYGLRYLANVKDPSLDQDAATKKYVDTAVATEATARQTTDADLQSQIDAISASSDVADIVGTYAELQSYDTSTLSDRDIVKVLQDEQHSDETTYYRWSTATQTFTLIGEEGPYYTKSAADTKFQDKLIAGTNIQIAADGKTISATDTTYSPFSGTDGTVAGAQGLVPAPATTDVNKFLNSDGAWEAIPPVTLYSDSGTNTDGAMTQLAASRLLFPSGSETSKDTVAIGSSASASSYGVAVGAWSSGQNGGVAIGHSTVSSGGSTIAIGPYARATHTFSLALGVNSRTSRGAEVAFGDGGIDDRYNTRYLAYVRAGERDTDAVNVAQLNAAVPTTLTDAEYANLWSNA